MWTIQILMVTAKHWTIRGSAPCCIKYLKQLIERIILLRDHNIRIVNNRTLRPALE
jgi:hypothetical protein